MSLLEIFAALFSALCVILAIKRNTLSYPIGIVGTVLYFFVFWDIKLYASAWLQVFFTAVQVYGWWYWLRGDHGKVPRIKRFCYDRTLIVGVIITIACYLCGMLIAANTDAQLATTDCVIFGLSVFAQILLDRKRLENWSVWVTLDVASVYVYGSAGLTVTAYLYAAFLVLAGFGWYAWSKAYKRGE